MPRFPLQDVSMICLDPNAAFSRSKPMVSHIRWHSRQLVRRIVQWESNFADGKDDGSKTDTAAEFVEGESIGAVKR
ncbi:hypothetical protein HZ994_01630 [Akkermansiaceae bacterium]|nr:hypothetical protein HZ994_01630 [Akkermansiaceae bacterium]